MPTSYRLIAAAREQHSQTVDLFTILRTRGVIPNTASQLAGSIQTKGLLVRLNRITLRLPRGQPTLENLHTREVQSQSPPQNIPAGLLAIAGAVDDRVLIPWNERRIRNHVLRWNPPRARNDLRVRKQVERLTNIENERPLARGQQLMKRLRLDAVPLQFTPIPQAFHPDDPEDQDAQPDRANRNQIHIHPSTTFQESDSSEAREDASRDHKGISSAC